MKQDIHSGGREILENEVYGFDGALGPDTCLGTCCAHTQCPPSITSLWIGQREFCALLDTGSQVSIISRAAWHQLTVQQQQNAYAEASGLSFLTGLSVISTNVEGIIHLPFKLAETGEEHVFPFALVGDEVIPCYLLLGLNLIRRLKMELNFDMGRFSLESGVQKYNRQLNQEMPQARLCEREHEGQQMPQDYALPAGIQDYFQFSTLLQTVQREIVNLQTNNFTMRLIQEYVLEKVDQKYWTKRCLLPFKRHTMAHIGRHKLIHHIKQH